jgi:predicted membrane protein
MKTKILPNIFFSISVLFASAYLLAAASDGALNFSNTSSLQPQAGPGPTIITFDVPGAGTAPGQGTIPFPINPAGAIAGRYIDAGDVRHGFVRAADGTITTFDAPGAGTGPGQGTRVLSMNPGGAIAGYYSDASDVFHAFLRAPDGTITTFDAPGAGTGPGLGTFAENINPAGVIAGDYEDDRFTVHSFVRAADGTITTFDAPGAGTGNDRGTYVFAVDNFNPAGAISGETLDASDVWRAFVRSADGTIAPFDVPGAGTGAFQGAFNVGINQAGTIAGDYIDGSNVFHGFVRTASGTIITFDAPGAGTGPGEPGCSFTDTCPGTGAENINPQGAITGHTVDDNAVNHGFLRAKNGAMSTFDVAGAGTGPGQGTFPVCNNPVDAITGYYIDANDVNHGFLRSPQHSPAH